MILVWVLGILLELILPHFEFLSALYPNLKLMYSHVCHQQIEKTIYFSDHGFLVCSRCSGIYVGSLISSFIMIFISSLRIQKISYLIIGLIPMLVDVILYSIGVYSYSKGIAFFSGFLFGMIGIIYIYNGLQILLEKPETN